LLNRGFNLRGFRREEEDIDEAYIFNHYRFSYTDYDTVPDENYDITPEYLKNRNFYKDDLEDIILKKQTLSKVNLFRG
jgi:hypothetical protein